MPKDTARPDSGSGRFRAFLNWVRLRVPRGARFLLGILLILGGFLGFLPILGFWMVPLSVAVAALDVRLFLRWRRRRMERRGK